MTIKYVQLSIFAILSIFMVRIDVWGKEKKSPLDEHLQDLRDENRFLRDSIRKQNEVHKLQGQNELLLMEKQCREGAYKKCVDLGMMEWEKKNKSKAKELWEFACDKDEGMSCYNLGNLYRHEKLYDRAIPPFEKACKQDIAWACNNLGESWYGKKNSSKSFEFYEKACTLELGEGCFNVFVLAKKEKQLDKSFVFLKRSCDLGSDEGCKEHRLWLDSLRKRDLPACKQGDLVACSTLGKIEYKSGNFDNAIKLYSLGCEQKDALSCFNKGMVFFKTSKIREAHRAWEMACILNDKMACQFSDLLKNHPRGKEKIDQMLKDIQAQK